jgi:hypothetical protein
VLTGREVECINLRKIDDWSEYSFRLKDERWKETPSKEKHIYSKLNYFEEGDGTGFKDALKKGTFLIKDLNRIYFRRRPLVIIENTIFHIISDRQILLEKIPDISHEFFENIIEKDSSKESKLVLLKDMLQVMGWGLIDMSIGKNKISMRIRNPPYGLQVEQDNWDFIIKVALGYMWLLDRRFMLKKIETAGKMLRIDFSH